MRCSTSRQVKAYIKILVPGPLSYCRLADFAKVLPPPSPLCLFPLTAQSTRQTSLFAQFLAKRSNSSGSF